jgi:hypothetical protein
MLSQCDVVRGECAIDHRPLRVPIIADALVIPMNRPRKPGVFGADGRLVPEASYRRGLPTLHLPLEDEHALCFGPHADVASSTFRYVYVGHLTGHYGHFLFSVLPRLWDLPRPIPTDIRLIALNGFRADELFRLDFARAILGSMGIGPDAFLPIRRPTIFPSLAVPEAAIEENIGGHPAFAHLCRWIGERLPQQPSAQAGRPIYLTKAQLGAGIFRIVNEDRLCEALARQGFEIIAPETLPFAEQVALWRREAPLAATFGSALHTSIFASGRHYTALNPQPWINSNQIIIDRLNGNEAVFLHPSNGLETVPEQDGFDHTLRFTDPEHIATDLAARVA